MLFFCGIARGDCPPVIADSAIPPTLLTRYAGNYDADSLLREPFVSAALLSNGAVTIYSANPDYGAQNLCIKDWITQVNSAHHDRFLHPTMYG